MRPHVASSLMMVVALTMSFSLGSCGDEELDYTCSEVIGQLYLSDCVMWCYYDQLHVYYEQCEWYKLGEESGFTQKQAEDVCGFMKDAAEEKNCVGEFQDMLECVVTHKLQCADVKECLDAYLAFTACAR